ncbi:hypothetical protein [Tumidithrix helvetica]|uniref:hypothetical protein n=1 Tax=Tumidithrix helvetica TaxID=3457545 RepID=UPI003CC50A69
MGKRRFICGLGVAGMIRFLQQFDVGEGDYTRDRYQVLDRLTMQDFQAYIHQQREGKDSSTH